MPNVNVVYGALGTRSMFAGMDLTCEMGVAHALGEVAPIHKSVTHEKGVYEVRDLLLYEKHIKYDLILRKMLEEGVIDHDTKVRVGSNGRLREVYLVKEKEAYRCFGTSYYGIYTQGQATEE